MGRGEAPGGENGESWGGDTQAWGQPAVAQTSSCLPRDDDTLPQSSKKVAMAMATGMGTATGGRALSQPRAGNYCHRDEVGGIKRANTNVYFHSRELRLQYTKITGCARGVEMQWTPPPRRCRGGRDVAPSHPHLCCQLGGLGSAWLHPPSLRRLWVQPPGLASSRPPWLVPHHLHPKLTRSWRGCELSQQVPM